MEVAQVAQEVQEDQEEEEEALEEAEVEVPVAPHIQEENWGGTHQQNLMATTPKRTPL